MKYLAKELAEQQELEEEEEKEIEPMVTVAPTFFGLEDTPLIINKSSVWDNFGKTGEMRTDLAMF